MVDEGFSLFAFAPADPEPLQIGQFSELSGICRQITALDSADIFLPIEWHSEIFDDGPAPGFVLQLCAREAKVLSALQSEMAELNLPGLAPSGIFAARSWPVEGQGAPAVRTAPVSFLVRYFSDMLPDADTFRAAYQASHPAILARFPAIRNVRCYVPHGQRNDTSVELLNEVVFDDTGALSAALESEVLQALRADTATLPERGDNAHHAMRRYSLLDL